VTASMIVIFFWSCMAIGYNQTSFYKSIYIFQTFLIILKRFNSLQKTWLFLWLLYFLFIMSIIW